MRIVLDAMGSDNYPVPDVAGAVLAAREWGDEIILVGREEIIRQELARHDVAGLKLEVVHAPEVIEMDDEPAWAARAKKNSSMHVGLGLVRDGQADGYVTAGNTGGVLAVATLHTLRRIRGVKRPALAAIMPLPAGHVIALDIGANADCRPEYLLQFALMGDVYARAVLGCTRPRVALLSNGEEPGKGNTLVKETYKLLTNSGLNFIGNVEPKELVTCHADVVVSDGFTGNIFIKTTEATARMLTDLIRDAIKASPLTAVGGLLAKPAFRRVARRVDPFEVGGGPLLGVNGVVIVAHGRSNERAIKNAIGQARKAVQGKIVEAIRDGLAKGQR
ncbi:MAG: phosphate acyltransferase PlsX [Chloroflexi bacterium]|nr:MAG: phosphate acyltransferase PlsX [Chloroflexota bacterium]RLC89192.1 MAG: phosphate acyltransferase PlsX [Chloroflexota bacterium]HEY68445.1 phosphate acyltransferase PlsX [Thermoflexia bacterium]